MSFIIVTDGHDAAGKTTLAEHLCKRHGAVMYHCGYRFRKHMFAYHAAVLRRAVAESAVRPVVIDRLWMSEVAYAAVYRGGTRWPHEGRFIDRVLLRWGAINVICATSAEAATAATEGRPGLYHDARQAEVARHFLGMVDGRVTAPETYLGTLQAQGGIKARQDFVHYDYRRDGRDLDAYTDSLVDAAKARRRDLPAFVLDPRCLNFLGHLSNRSKVLIVGDQSNPKNPKVAWPFFEYGNCSLYLAEVCHRAGLREDTTLWTNAHDPGAEDFIAASYNCAPVRTIALGSSASQWLGRRGWKHERLGHPQHWRRFAYKDKHAHAAQLSALL